MRVRWGENVRGCVRMALCWHGGLSPAGRETPAGNSWSAGTDRVCPVRPWEASKRSEESER